MAPAAEWGAIVTSARSRFCKRVGCWEYVRPSNGDRPSLYCSADCKNADKQQRYRERLSVSAGTQSKGNGRHPKGEEKNGHGKRKRRAATLAAKPPQPPTSSDRKAWNRYLASIGLSMNAGNFLLDAPSGRGLPTQLTDELAALCRSSSDPFTAGFQTFTTCVPVLTVNGRRGNGKPSTLSYWDGERKRKIFWYGSGNAPDNFERGDD